jgi:hypothetical protein
MDKDKLTLPAPRREALVAWLVQRGADAPRGSFNRASTWQNAAIVFFHELRYLKENAKMTGEMLAGPQAKKKGIHFVQIVGESMPESALAEAVSVE